MDIRKAIEKLTKIVIKVYDSPTTEEMSYASGQSAVRNKQLDEWSKIKLSYKENKVKMYYVFMGQCSEAMVNKLKDSAIYKDVENRADLILLLKQIKIFRSKFKVNITRSRRHMQLYDDYTSFTINKE